MTVRLNVVSIAVFALAVINLGCKPAATPPPPASTAASAPGGSAPVVPATDGTNGGDSSSLGNNSVVGGNDPDEDTGTPLTFELTDEERARQAAEGPIAPPSSGSITDAVPEALKTGPVGSLGRALFKGVIGSGSQSDSGSGGEEPSGDEATSDEATSDEKSDADPAK